MTNAIDEVRSAEARAKKIISDAKEEARLIIAKGEKDGRAELLTAVESSKNECARLISSAKESAEKTLEDGEQALKNVTGKITDAAEKNMDRAVALIVGEAACLWQ